MRLGQLTAGAVVLVLIGGATGCFLQAERQRRQEGRTIAAATIRSYKIRVHQSPQGQVSVIPFAEPNDFRYTCEIASDITPVTSFTFADHDGYKPDRIKIAEPATLSEGKNTIVFTFIASDSPAIEVTCTLSDACGNQGADGCTAMWSSKYADR